VTEATPACGDDPARRALRCPALAVGGLVGLLGDHGPDSRPRPGEDEGQRAAPAVGREVSLTGQRAARAPQFGRL
jgi:hypothetical protein